MPRAPAPGRAAALDRARPAPRRRRPAPAAPTPSTRSRSPPVSVATTGSPAAIASWTTSARASQGWAGRRRRRPAASVGRVGCGPDAVRRGRRCAGPAPRRPRAQVAVAVPDDHPAARPPRERRGRRRRGSRGPSAGRSARWSGPAAAGSADSGRAEQPAARAVAARGVEHVGWPAARAPGRRHGREPGVGARRARRASRPGRCWRR